MNRFTTANLQNGILRYKHLTVGDVRPDATAKLYKRMFKSSSRKYIPVKDVTNDTMGRELNAYLINPEYIDKSVVAADVVSSHLEPRPVVKVIQYSRLSYQRPALTEQKALLSKIAAVFGSAMHIGRQAISTTSESVAKIATAGIHSPFGKTYSLRAGTGIHRRRKLFAKATSIAAVASFAIIGLSNLNTQDTTVQPKPPSAQTANSGAGSIINAGITPNQPIPIFANSTQAARPDVIAAPVISMQQNHNAGAYAQSLATPSVYVPPVNQPSIIENIPTNVTPLPSTTEPATNPPTPIVIDPVVVDPVVVPGPAPDATILTPVVEGVVETTTQTIEVVDGLVDGLLGSN